MALARIRRMDGAVAAGPSCARLGRASTPVPPHELTLRLLVLVEGIQEPVDILLRQVVRRGQAQLVRFGSADSNFLFFPQPVLQIHADDWRHIYGCYCAAHRS